MSETETHTRKRGSVDAKRITISVYLLITVVVGVLPAAAMSGVGMYRLGLVESKTIKHDDQLDTVDHRLDAHDLELNTRNIDAEYFKKTLNEIKVMLNDIKKGNK